MRTLIHSWIAAERSRGMTLGSAIQRLNSVRGTSVTYSRVAEWRRGVYVPTPVTLSYVLVRTLPWALRQAGISATKEQYGALEKLLWTIENDESGTELIYFV